MLVEILTVLAVGTIVGVLGRLVLPGRQYVSPMLTIFIGVVAALVGTAVARTLGITRGGGIGWTALGIQVLLAAACVALVAGRRPRASL